MMAAGTQASGGMGRSSSNTGKTSPRTVRLSATTSPNGMPTATAAMNPMATRWKLSSQLHQ